MSALPLILDTTILTDFRLHACTITIIYYQFCKNNIKLIYRLFLQAVISRRAHASHAVTDVIKMEELQDYQTANWLKALSQTSYELTPSQKWGSNAWYLPDADLDFQPTEWKVYNHGTASATAIGGNLSTFSLLQGTLYAPCDTNYLLLVELSEGSHYLDFNRLLTSLLQTYPQSQALLIGHFPKECQMTEEILYYILDKHPILKTIPVLYDLDFAHTQPLFTITIGAQMTVDTHPISIRIDK